MYRITGITKLQNAMSTCGSHGSITSCSQNARRDATAAYRLFPLSASCINYHQLWTNGKPPTLISQHIHDRSQFSPAISCENQPRIGPQIFVWPRFSWKLADISLVFVCFCHDFVEMLFFFSSNGHPSPHHPCLKYRCHNIGVELSPNSCGFGLQDGRPSSSWAGHSKQFSHRPQIPQVPMQSQWTIWIINDH